MLAGVARSERLPLMSWFRGVMMDDVDDDDDDVELAAAHDRSSETS